MLPAKIELSTVQQLAEFLHKSPHSIYSDSIRRPESLPPIVRIPGSKRLLFANMREWAAGFVSQQTQSHQTTTQRSRGAPTKAESMRKRGAK